MPVTHMEGMMMPSNHCHLQLTLITSPKHVTLETFCVHQLQMMKLVFRHTPPRFQSNGVIFKVPFFPSPALRILFLSLSLNLFLFFFLSPGVFIYSLHWLTSVPCVVVSLMFPCFCLTALLDLAKGHLVQLPVSQSHLCDSTTRRLCIPIMACNL